MPGNTVMQNPENLKASSFVVPEDFEAGEFVSLLKSMCVFKEEDQQVKTIRLFDTFDWRLFNQKWVMYQVGNLIYLHGAGNGTDLIRQEYPYAPVFVKDLPSGKIKEALDPIVEMRALLKRVESSKVTRSFRILNKCKKIVTWLEYVELLKDRDIGSGSITAFVRLHPVRGYKSRFKRLEESLLNAGFRKAGIFDLFTAVMENSGVEPGDYSSKINIQLEPELSSGAAIKRILLYLFETMQRNEEGILEDIDSEFLHDYRVAIRRTRSAFTQLKGVFGVTATEQFKSEFAKLGDLTNSLRDMDVFLLYEDLYMDMLPEELKPGINPIFDRIKKDRSGEFSRVKQGLQSAAYKKFKHDYENFLEEHAHINPSVPNAAKPIFLLAKDRIYKRYRRVIKDGKHAQKSADERDMHRLRIECKKLRYLIEFFSSLFPSEKISKLLKQLRTLQDNLGDFNDLCVQTEHLMSISLELPVEDGKYTRSLLAIGSLIGALEQQKQSTKNNFSATFEGFSDPQNLAIYKELFSPKV